MEYKVWGEMTREEKGELLLAQHEGKIIQERVPAVLDYHSWLPVTTYNPPWRNDSVYRVKPEPKAETVVIHGRDFSYYGWSMSADSSVWGSRDTHKITFNVVDGVVDCNSVRMEAL